MLCPEPALSLIDFVLLKRVRSSSLIVICSSSTLQEGSCWLLGAIDMKQNQKFDFSLSCHISDTQ